MPGSTKMGTPCPIPNLPLEISGPSEMDQEETGLVFSITPRPGERYIWEVPDGTAITSGQGEYSITLSADCPATGNISVTAHNAGGVSSSARDYSITVQSTLRLPTPPI